MPAATLAHYPEAATVRDGRLAVGGCDAVELAREFGTPAYVVAEDDLRARAREFRAALAAHHDGPGEVVFASKAFPCTAVLRVFAEEGLGCDVASGGELHLALRAGFAPERIYLHGNAKSEAELRMAVEAGVGWIVLDNADDVAKLGARAAPGARQRVLLRVTPGVHAETHAAILTGHAASKFGFEPAEAAALAAARARPPRRRRASTSTSAPSSSTSSRTARRSRRSPRSRTCRSTPSAAGWRCPTRPPTARPARRPPWRPWRRPRARCSGPASGS